MYIVHTLECTYKIIHSSETFPRLYSARSTTASLAGATCNDATSYHLSEVLSTAMNSSIHFSARKTKTKTMHLNVVNEKKTMSYIYFRQCIFVINKKYIQAVGSLYY
jgi:hypothetical protein